MEWKDQYKHPNWQKRRLEILERAGWCCEYCGDEKKQLHVHHKQYVKGRKVWEYQDDELEALCDSCHENRHALNDRLKAALSDCSSSDIERVIGYVEAFQTWNCDFPDDRKCVFPIGIDYLNGLIDALGGRFNLTEEGLISEVKDGRIPFSYILSKDKKQGK